MDLVVGRKSFVSALVGIAVSEGHIDSIDDPIDRYAGAHRDGLRRRAN